MNVPIIHHHSSPPLADLCWSVVRGRNYENFYGSDYDTATGEYPDVLGCSWDGELYAVHPALKPIADFKFDVYNASIENKKVHQISVEMDGRISILKVEPYADIALILEQINSVEVFFDTGSDDGGPASGAGYIFFCRR